VSPNRAPVVLTIAGFDPSGGAGIITDLETIQAFGCRPAAAITSLTFQNSQAVFGAVHETAASVRAQILPLIEENEIAAVKTGMLPTEDIVSEVAQLVRDKKLPPPVVDPVFRSSSGSELVEQDAVKALVNELVPLARLITPNIPEAERLTGLHIEDEHGMREAACNLRKLGARGVLIKGGHLVSSASGLESPRRLPAPGGGCDRVNREAIDLLDDNWGVTVFRDEWIDATNMRGTGCILSSAIAACLGRGESLNEAVRLAKKYVSNRIRQFASVLQLNLAGTSTVK